MTTNVAVWLRVSTDHQDSDNQVPDVERFCSHHGYRIAARYEISDTAWKNGGGREYKATLQRALDDAWRGDFSVLVVWALDRIVRDDESGAEAALRIIRQFRERGCTVVSVKESWLNGSAEVQDVLIAFAAGWPSRKAGASPSASRLEWPARRRGASRSAVLSAHRTRNHGRPKATETGTGGRHDRHA